MEAPTSPTRLYFPVSSESGPGGYDALAEDTALAEFCFDVDAQRVHYLEQKRQVAARPGRGPLRAAGGATEQTIQAARQFVRERMLELPAFRAQAARLQSSTLDDLMFELQEDLVIMHCPAGHTPERARALYMHVCFPGGWDPAQLLGKSVTALHARVPYEPGFDRSERAAHAERLFQAPLARYVWSVTAEPTLDRHPKTPRLHDLHSATELFLRVERQIMVPLTEAGTSLFFIRTYVYGCDRLSAEQRSKLAEAISCMSEAMRRYKGMFGHEQRILQLLG
jgi:Protein of unknown function (DUF3445)